MTWKFIQIEPQKARGTLREEMWNSPEWVAEEKYDGDRRIAQFCDSSLVRFTGCRQSVDGSGFVEKTGNLPHLNGEDTSQFTRSALRRLAGTVLDGEMVVPFGKEIQGGKSKYVTSIMGSAPDKAKQKQMLGGYLCYVVFDCLFYKGKDLRGLTLRDRKNYLLQAHTEWGNAYTALATQAVGVGKRRLFDTVVERGGEGVVLKRFDHTYGDQTLWVKVKAEATADVVVMGFEPGKGKYTGQIGAIKFGQYRYRCGKLTLDLIGTCSGFDDALRRLLTANGRRFVGRAFEIRHNGREPTGAFRHPRFSRWREDKSKFDCTFIPEES